MNQKSKKIIRIFGLLIFLALGVKILTPYIKSIPDSINALKGLNYWALALAIAFEFLKFLGSGQLINSIIGLFKQRVSIWQATMIVLASSSFGMVGGGMVGSAAASFQWLRERQVKAHAAMMAGILPIIFSALSILILALIGIIYLLGAEALTPSQMKGFLAILGLITLALVLIFIFFRNPQKSKIFAVNAAKKIEKITKKTYEEDKIAHQLDELFEVRDLFFHGGWKKLLIANAMIYGFDLLSLYFLFLAAGQVVSPRVLLIGYGLPQILGKATFVLPGGIGVVESAMIDLYQKLGVPAAEAVVVVLAYRFIAFLVPTILGFLFVLYLQKKVGKKETKKIL
ncbi:MAG: flippase-like domain-containing protein [Anaerolineaceae bacterium]